MKIYRVVDCNDNGMYFGVSSLWWKSTKGAHNDHIHPVPEESDEIMEQINESKFNSLICYHFGFVSIEQLKRWIHKPIWRKRMHDNGGKILVFECIDDVIFDSHQAIFIKDRAKIVGMIELIDPILN